MTWFTSAASRLLLEGNPMIDRIVVDSPAGRQKILGQSFDLLGLDERGDPVPGGRRRPRLARRHPSQPGPHNSLLTYLVRMGVRGLGLWLALQLALADRFLIAWRRARREGDRLLAGTMIWILAYFSGYGFDEDD